MTGLEDFGLEESDVLNLHGGIINLEPSNTSSFVQKILYEDACAGLAVMDLFVAIKAVKENLDVLEERNNDFFEKIHHLNAETKFFMKEYEHLRCCITEFLNQIEGDMKIQEVMNTRRKRERTEEIRRKKSTDDIVSKKRKECRGSVKHPASESKLNGTPSSSKEKPPVLSTTVLPEAMMVSFLAALVCLEKEQKRSSLMAGSSQGGKGKSDGTHHQESHKPPEGEGSDSLSQRIIAAVNMNKKSSEGDAKSLNSKTDNFSQKEKPSTKIEDEDLKMSTANDATTSEDEEIFREAVSSVATAVPPSPEKISSVTCMGDLNKEFIDNQNESFVFKADLDPTRVWRLATDICSKVIKTKRKKKEKVLQQHRQSQQGSSCKNIVADSLKFTVSTNTPMGVFDVTVVPHKKRRLLSKKPESDFTDSDITSSPAITEDSMSSIHSPTETWDPKAKKSGQTPKTGVQIKEGQTNKILKCCFESTSTIYFSDEESPETFVDAYVEHTKLGDVMEKTKTKKGQMQQLCYFWENPTFFEIYKCHPVYYSQCFTKKVSEVRDHVDVSYMDRNSSDETIISLNPGERGEKTMVIGGQSSDLVIYIQVELEDESRTNSENSVGYQSNSLGTQTAEIIVPSERKKSNEKSIKLEENIQEGKSLFKIWKCALEAKEENNLVNEISSSNTVKPEVPGKITDTELEDPEILDFFEVMSEKEIQETRPEEIKSAETVSKMNLFSVMAAKQKAHIWFVQNNLMPVHRGEIRKRKFPTSPVEDFFDSKGVSGFELNLKSVELEDAMKLIHEIESDVAEVKLNDALSILPRLETELRKHVKEKLKSLQQVESKTEGDSKKTPTHSTKESKSEDSKGRLSSLLAIISSLEDAVKLNDSSNVNNVKSKVCGYNSSTIFTLLHALTDSIRQVEETPTVTNLSKTIDLASRLDVAIRGEESVIKQPVEYFLPEPKQEVQQSVAEVISEQNLKGTRKRIFERVEDEATDVEDRLEKDFERLDRLERENDELLMFLEAFLQKTGRRVSELGDLKDKLKGLSSSLNEIYDTLKSIRFLQKEERKNRMEAEKRIAAVKERSTKASLQNPEKLALVKSFHEILSPASSSTFLPSRTLVVSHVGPIPQPSSTEASRFVSSTNTATPSSTKYSTSTWEPIRETPSGLLQALNALKSKAEEKKQFYMEILNTKELATSREQNNESQQSSITTFSSKQSEQLGVKIKKFKKIDGHSCYMAWSKPKSLLEGPIEGYHIYVNGKINHRVRNPERRQAVLCSVDFKHKAVIDLYAITQKTPKILLATYTQQPTEESTENE